MVLLCLETGEKIVVADSSFCNFTPAFELSGRFLSFLSSRTFAPLQDEARPGALRPQRHSCDLRRPRRLRRSRRPHGLRRGEPIALAPWAAASARVAATSAGWLMGRGGPIDCGERMGCGESMGCGDRMGRSDHMSCADHMGCATPLDAATPRVVASLLAVATPGDAVTRWMWRAHCLWRAYCAGLQRSCGLLRYQVPPAREVRRVPERPLPGLCAHISDGLVAKSHEGVLHVRIMSLSWACAPLSETAPDTLKVTTDLGFPTGSDLPYLVLLRKDAENPFKRPALSPAEIRDREDADDGDEGEEEGEDGDGEDDDGSEGSGAGEEKHTPPEKIQIDLEGIGDRILQFPLPFGKYSCGGWTQSGKFQYLRGAELARP